MPADDSFADRLTLILKALSISRGRLAAAIGIDKSVAGRWCSGAVTPTALNLERLTHFIAERAPGFTLYDWELGIDALASRFGVVVPIPPAVAAPLPGLADLIPPALLAEALTTGKLRGEAYEGFWRVTRPSAELGGRFVHNHMIQRLSPTGLLTFRLGVFDLRFDGWALLVQNQIFSMSSDAQAGVFIFGIVNGVPRNKAMVVDGVTLTCLRNFDGNIVATPTLFERVGDLSGDVAADDAQLEELMKLPSIAPEGSISPEVAAYLLPDVGPAAHANGGALTLMMQFARSMARAAPIGGGVFMGNDAAADAADFEI